MAAKSDGAAVSVEDDNPPRSAPDPGVPSIPSGGRRPYTLLDCCWVLCALLVFFSDGATDLWLAADYYLRGDYWWFGLTLVFVVVPSAVVQVLSFRWFVYDYTELSGDAAVTESDAAFGTKDSGGGGEQRGDGAAVHAGNAAGSGPAVCGSSGAASPRSCCTVCMWVFQSVLHVLQLGQVRSVSDQVQNHAGP
uniref:XK-related protein n=1 Tax=Gouania willdenowi TaxID=441366 RepID=A0A8C5GLE4_GOUWI